MPQFTPTENEFTLLEPGQYGATVSKAEEGTSKAGNPVIKLTLDVYDHDGNTRKVWDILTFTAGAAFRIAQFCRSIGKHVEIGQIASLEADECINQDVRIDVGIEPASGQYAEKNKVLQYIAKDVQTSSSDTRQRRPANDIQVPEFNPSDDQAGLPWG